MSQRLKADLSLMFCSLIWGITFVVVKNVLDHASPFVFLVVRFSIAVILMAILRPQVIQQIEDQEIFAGMRLAFFMFAGYCFQTAGLQYTTASNSGFVTGSSVVLVPLLLGVFWGRKLTRWIYVGVVVAESAFTGHLSNTLHPPAHTWWPWRHEPFRRYRLPQRVAVTGRYHQALLAGLLCVTARFRICRSNRACHRRFG